MLPRADLHPTSVGASIRTEFVRPPCDITLNQPVPVWRAYLSENERAVASQVTRNIGCLSTFAYSPVHSPSRPTSAGSGDVNAADGYPDLNGKQHAIPSPSRKRSLRRPMLRSARFSNQSAYDRVERFRANSKRRKHDEP